MVFNDYPLAGGFQPIPRQSMALKINCSYVSGQQDVKSKGILPERVSSLNARLGSSSPVDHCSRQCWMPVAKKQSVRPLTSPRTLSSRRRLPLVVGNSRTNMAVVRLGAMKRWVAVCTMFVRYRTSSCPGACDCTYLVVPLRTEESVLVEKVRHPPRHVTGIGPSTGGGNVVHLEDLGFRLPDDVPPSTSRRCLHLQDGISNTDMDANVLVGGRDDTCRSAFVDMITLASSAAQTLAQASVATPWRTELDAKQLSWWMKSSMSSLALTKIRRSDGVSMNDTLRSRLPRAAFAPLDAVGPSASNAASGNVDDVSAWPPAR